MCFSPCRDRDTTSAYKSKVVPTTTIVCLVNPDIRDEEADEKNDSRNGAMPESGEESRGFCSRKLVFGTGAGDGQNICHTRMFNRSAGNINQLVVSRIAINSRRPGRRIPDAAGKALRPLHPPSPPPFPSVSECWAPNAAGRAGRLAAARRRIGISRQVSQRIAVDWANSYVFCWSEYSILRQTAPTLNCKMLGGFFCRPIPSLSST